MIEELDITELVRAVELVSESYRLSTARFSGWKDKSEQYGASGEAIFQLQSRE